VAVAEDLAGEALAVAKADPVAVKVVVARAAEAVRGDVVAEAAGSPKADPAVAASRTIKIVAN
jgi:hypothetical protein